jgi:hypothetical protein
VHRAPSPLNDTYVWQHQQDKLYDLQPQSPFSIPYSQSPARVLCAHLPAVL